MYNHTLVYQAYGKEDLIKQAIFSIISLYSKLPSGADLGILIYTDKPNSLQIFSGNKNIKIEEISPDKIKEWRGKIDFVHRVKIEILLDAVKKGCKNLFYCDGDTYFLKDPMPLFLMVNKFTSLMHLPESSLALGKDPISKKMRKFVKANKFQVSGKPVAISENTVMWNAGVIGLDFNNTNLLQNILELTDEMHSKYPKHVTEQLAVSWALQSNSTILSADEEIYHYWNQKEIYQELVNSFLAENTNFEMAISKIGAIQFPAPPIKKKSLLKRIFSRNK
jgi:hypothetical protein